MEAENLINLFEQDHLFQQDRKEDVDDSKSSFRSSNEEPNEADLQEFSKLTLNYLDKALPSSVGDPVIPWNFPLLRFHTKA